MSFELVRTYRFEAAHWLPRVPEDHRCHALHGHSYELDVHVGGELDPELGWVVDYAAIDAAAQPLVDSLDHVCLNDLEGLGNPTSELLARWLWSRVAAHLDGLRAIVVRETRDSAAVYRGPS
jgi:6-pyruvoyltetrahydropterin/6-carboxytetrahydropterin synthase